MNIKFLFFDSELKLDVSLDENLLLDRFSSKVPKEFCTEEESLLEFVPCRDVTTYVFYRALYPELNKIA